VLAIAAIVAGFGLLAVAPDRFVSGSARLADRWGVSRVVIGAVVVGFGTSTPEMLVSGVAAGRGDPEVGVGNVVGSNMANIGLIIGVAALIGRLAVPDGLLRRELPLMVAATVLFAALVQGGLSRPEGLVLLATLAAVLVFVLRQAEVEADEPAEAELAEEVEEFLADESVQPAGRLVVDAATGLLGTLLGAQLLVWGAVDIAESRGLSGGFVGLTIVALGTSLPELVTAVAAARVGEDQLILGNVVGSNLFNCLAVGGVVGVVGPATIDERALTVGAVSLMLVITGLGAAVLLRHREVSRNEALGLLVTYLACLPLLAF
jgi:cation:H+ antiporter